MPKILRITTVPISLDLLLTDQMGYMRKNGFEVLMMSADGKEVEQVIAREECPHVIVPFTRKISPFKDLKCLWKVIQVIRREKPDIVHTHTPKAGLIGMLAAKFCGVQLKMHTIAGLPLMTATGNKKRLLIFIEKLTYWAADYVLPNSKSIMTFVKENRFAKERKLTMIGGGSSNGIDLQRFSRDAIQDKKLEAVKRLIQYDINCKYILAVGRVVWDKGIVELVEAFLKLQNTNENLRLIIVGPLEKERTEELLPAHVLTEIENNTFIKHIHWSEEVEYYMYLANLLVHASHREGFPNVPLQAGAMECPIVCSEIPGNIDIVTDQKTGIYFEVRNMKDLYNKLNWAIENESQMLNNAMVLRGEIQNQFSRNYIHSELLSFYQARLL